MIPIDASIKFLTRFFKEGWEYFYKIGLAIIMNLEHRIVKMNELDKVVAMLKFKELKP